MIVRRILFSAAFVSTVAFGGCLARLQYVEAVCALAVSTLMFCLHAGIEED